jgi:hypothetical protein
MDHVSKVCSTSHSGKRQDANFDGWTVVDFETDWEFSDASAHYLAQVRSMRQAVAAAAKLPALGLFSSSDVTKVHRCCSRLGPLTNPNQALFVPARPAHAERHRSFADTQPGDD